MIVGFSFLGLDDGLIFGISVVLPSFNKVELSNGVIDNIYITKDLTTTTSTTKPTQWEYYDVLNSEFELSLEGGSVDFNGSIIDHLLIQRRLASDLLWKTIKTITYTSGTSLLFSLIDTFVQQDMTYQYALIPVSNQILGNQVVSPDPNVTASFDSNFLTDSTNNYKLKYDNKFDAFPYNQSTTVIEPLDSQFPIVITNSLNYRSSRLSALLISDASISNNISGLSPSINQEYQLRKQIIAFLSNKQPKLLRTMLGDNILIMIVDKPEITFRDDNSGLASISFSFVEIGNSDLETLALNGLVI